MGEKELFPVRSDGVEEKDMHAILTKYLRYWYLFLIGLLVCLGLGYFYLQYTIPQYYVSSKLLIREAKDGPAISGGEGFVNLDIFKSNKNIDNEMEMLKATSLMQRVLEELSLNTSYYFEGALRNTEIYAESSPIKVVVSRLDTAAYYLPLRIHIQDNNSFMLEESGKLSNHKFGQQIEKPYGVFTILASVAGGKFKKNQTIIVQFHDIRKQAKVYAQKLNIVQTNQMASVLSLSMTDAVPEKGKDIIMKLIEVYDKEAMEDKNLMASSTLDFIDERLKYLTIELTDVEKDVEQYKRRNSVTDVSSQIRLYLEEASEYNKELANLGVQIDILESIEEYLKKQGNQYQLVPSSLSIQDPTLQRLIQRFNELQMERERLLRTTQPDNPLVHNMSEQLSNLQLNILENLRNIKNSLAISRKNLEAKSVQFGSRISQVPEIERELQEIGRQQGLKEALYLYLLQKREESALSLASATSTSRIIDPAEATDYPISPSRNKILLLAFLLGICLPVAGLYFSDLMNDKVQLLKEVEKNANTPVLGEIAHTNQKEVLAVTGEKQSLIAEYFRLVRANLQFTSVGKDNRVIMITSSMSGEGKTFISINLGASLALTGKRVVVLSFDLRKPKLMQHMGLPNNVGITNYLVNKSFSIDEILIPSPHVPNLFLIGSGPIPFNPTELMMSGRVGALIDELKNSFDYILLDTAPVGQVADAFTLSPLVDSCIYVVRYGYTFKAQLKIIQDIYRNRKIPYPMIVMNDAKKKNGYSSGYGYGYGYGYGENKKKKFRAAS